MANNDQPKFEVVLDQECYEELRKHVEYTLLLCEKYPVQGISRKCKAVYQRMKHSLQHAQPISLPFD